MSPLNFRLISPSSFSGQLIWMFTLHLKINTSTKFSIFCLLRPKTRETSLTLSFSHTTHHNPYGSSFKLYLEPAESSLPHPYHPDHTTMASLLDHSNDIPTGLPISILVLFNLYSMKKPE